MISHFEHLNRVCSCQRGNRQLDTHTHRHSETNQVLYPYGTYTGSLLVFSTAVHVTPCNAHIQMAGDVDELILYDYHNTKYKISSPTSLAI